MKIQFYYLVLFLFLSKHYLSDSEAEVSESDENNLINQDQGSSQEDDENEDLDESQASEEIQEQEDSAQEQETTQQSEDETEKAIQQASDFGTLAPVNELDEEQLRQNQLIQQITEIRENVEKCINDIQMSEFNQQAIDKCTGNNFLDFMMELQYLIMNEQLFLEDKIHNIFLIDCYEPANSNIQSSHACDAFENDIKDLVWRGFNFQNTLESNKNKYINFEGKLKQKIFENIQSQLNALVIPFWKRIALINENHDSTLVKLKIFIEEKWQEFRDSVLQDPTLGSQSNIQQQININESKVYEPIEEAPTVDSEFVQEETTEAKEEERKLQ